MLKAFFSWPVWPTEDNSCSLFSSWKFFLNRAWKMAFPPKERWSVFQVLLQTGSGYWVPYCYSGVCRHVEGFRRSYPTLEARSQTDRELFNATGFTSVMAVKSDVGMVVLCTALRADVAGGEVISPSAFLPLGSRSSLRPTSAVCKAHCAIYYRVVRYLLLALNVDDQNFHAASEDVHIGYYSSARPTNRSLVRGFPTTEKVLRNVSILYLVTKPA